MFVETLALPPRQREAPTGSHVVTGAHNLHGAGLIPAEVALWVQQDATPVAVKDLFAWAGEVDSASPPRFHEWSRLLYNYLWNRRGKQLADYQRRLGDGDLPEAAWRSAMPGFDPADPKGLAALDRELGRGGRILEGLGDLYRLTTPFRVLFDAAAEGGRRLRSRERAGRDRHRRRDGDEDYVTAV